MSCGGIFDVDEKIIRIEELESLAADPEFWNDPEKAQDILRETKQAKTVVATVRQEESRLEDAAVFLELAQEGDDQESFIEAEATLAAVESSLADLEFRRMLSGEMDEGDAVVSVNSGAGGVEACDWAGMLLRMLLRYAEKKEWKTELVDEQPGDEAGIKSATFLVSGEFAYGLLKAESGVHRLVRISPFDSNARRHTSFASVSVSPDIDDSIEVEVNEADLRIDVYRASGAGGQHINKTESAVRITHMPSGIVVQCQSDRSQHKNRAQAMRVLRSRLYEKAIREQEEKAAADAAAKKKIEWGSQIRSYVLAPYQQVTDHRTELKLGNVDAILDGDLEQLIREALLQQSTA